MIFECISFNDLQFMPTKVNLDTCFAFRSQSSVEEVTSVVTSVTIMTE